MVASAKPMWAQPPSLLEIPALQLIDGRPVYSISDLINDIECEHLTQLEREVALGELSAPTADAGTELIARKGDEHEQRFLEALRAKHGAALVEFPSRLAQPSSLAALQAADAATFEAMRQGASIIYQASFFDGTFVGRADFLRRIEVPSAHWSWSYELIDTKLALSVKAQFPIQLAHYSAQVQRLQGSAPEWGFIALGNSVEQSFRLKDFAAYYRNRRSIFLQKMDRLQATYPAECKQCALCRWSKQCDQQRDLDDHLSLIANIRKEQIGKLQTAGINSLTQLAQASDTERPSTMNATTFSILRAQARLQHKQRNAALDTANTYTYELLEARQDEGFAKLPKPDAGDIFFDIEGDPMYKPDHGLEYLWGFTMPAEAEYRDFWARSDTEERITFENVVDFLTERRQQYPDMHVYHYAPYEITALKRLAGRYSTRVEELDQLLRTEVFVDLYAVVRQSLRISQPSYSIKKLEPFYGMTRNTDVRRGDDSIVQFEEWLMSGDDTILEDIRRYNEDDCRSTWLLRDWLLERKQELESQTQSTIAWKSEPTPKPQSEQCIENQEDRAFFATVDEPNSLAEFRALPDVMRAKWIMGHLLGYHQREAKPSWWKLFDRCANRDQLLEEDHEAIGGLELDATITPYYYSPRDRNLVYVYTFPNQQYKIEAGEKCICPEIDTQSKHEIITIDTENNRLHLKLSNKFNPADVHSLIPPGPIGTADQQKSLQRIAQHVVLHGFEQKSALLDIILARAPRLKDREAGATIQPESLEAEKITEIIQALDDSYLVIQGPPGTGKSTKAASIILKLIANQKRVAILAGKHKAIHNLLHKIEEIAQERGERFVGLQKFSKTNNGSKFESKLKQPMISPFDDNEVLNTQHMLVTGVQWFLSTEQMVGKYDYLFIDEAGQLSLADALACAPVAKNIILLGDPLQLAHVSQGTHPIGTGCSVLEHLLGEHATIPGDRGIFLDISYRMAPGICDFISSAVYDDRLHAHPPTLTNSVTSSGLSGSGLRYMPVTHQANMRSSLEEAERIAHEIQLLLQGEVVLRDKPRRAIEPRDILVVTPYNAQRTLIHKQLTARGISGIEIGTVDKFQGLEAPVVFYSMATSSVDEIPRNIEFLFEQNRFNVALSRAQCLAIIVCSPKLLNVRCSNPEQIALVNMLCALVEYCEARVPRCPERKTLSSSQLQS